jgi:type IV pilus assembly protein PilC
MIFSKKTFFDANGNFINRDFLRLFNNASAAVASGKKPALKRKNKGGTQIIVGGISGREVWQFINKFSNLLSNGVDLKTSIHLLYNQARNQKLKRILNDVRINLDQGMPVSETLQEHQKYFDPLIISLIKVGEATGTLPRVLSELEKKLLENLEIRGKILSAMIYPAILMLITIWAISVIMMFVVPRIAATFATTRVELPLLTRVIIGTSNFLVNNIFLIILWAFASTMGIIAFRRTEYGQFVFSWIAIRLPVFGYIVRQGNIILFINSLSLLLDSGILLLEALEITQNVAPNTLYKRDIARVRNEVETGLKLSTAMGLTVSNKEIMFINQYFPEDLVHVVDVGEQTGKIASVIQRVGANYSVELKRYVGNLVAMLEPFIIVFIGSIIGFIVVGIMLPFMQLAQVVGSGRY